MDSQGPPSDKATGRRQESKGYQKNEDGEEIRSPRVVVKRTEPEGENKKGRNVQGTTGG